MEALLLLRIWSLSFTGDYFLDIGVSIKPEEFRKTPQRYRFYKRTVVLIHLVLIHHYIDVESSYLLLYSHSLVPIPSSSF